MPSPAKFRSRARHATIFVRNLSIPTHRKKTFRNRQAFKHLHQPCNTFQTLSNPPAGIPASPKPFAGTFLGPKNTNNFRENTSGTHEPSDTSSTRNLPVPPEPSGTLFCGAGTFFFLRRRKKRPPTFRAELLCSQNPVPLKDWKVERSLWKVPQLLGSKLPPKARPSKSSNCFLPTYNDKLLPGVPPVRLLHGLELIHCLRKVKLKPPQESIESVVE